MYKEIKVYETDEGRNVYLNRGQAIDHSAGWDPDYGKLEATVPTESRLLYTAQQGKELEQIISAMSSVTVYRYVVRINRETVKKSSWFMTQEDAKESPLAKEYPEHTDNATVWIDWAWLGTLAVEPVKFPLIVDLEPGKDGRLYTHVNLHPEIDGSAARGVVCFPDRSMKACAGRAVITGVKEKGTYAFLMGHMLQYGMPDMKKFLDFVWHARCFSHDMQIPLSIVNHPMLGRLLCTEKYVWVETETTQYFQYDQNRRWYDAYYKVEWTAPSDIDQYVERKTTLRDLLIEDGFGPETTAESIINLFPECNCIQHRFNEAWDSSNKVMPEIIEDAIAEGILEVWSLPNCNIHVLRLDPGMSHRFAAFSMEEIEEMATEYARINAEADSLVTSKLKKGKLRMIR